MLASLKRLFKEAANTEKKEVHCLCCGQCCESFGSHLHASERDKQRWKREGRDDLLARVNRLDWIWVDPDTKNTLDRCPFITVTTENQKICAIQETKPDICRDYPTLAHGKRCLHGVFM